MQYSSSSEAKDYKSRIIQVGNLVIGGDNPIRLQSMTSTNTMDTKATVEQSIRMIEAGCELVRSTAPGIKEARNLSIIKTELNKRGYFVPIIADIHFNPKAAEIAAEKVEKIRINPGNYVERNRGKLVYNKSDYQTEIDKIEHKLLPLIKICKSNGTAMRIGSNHGSLSDRILSQFGDSPLGMVESALEFVRICVKHNFYRIIISMKASNVKVMVQSNRLLVDRMKKEKFNFPIHLGVTEAGDGEDGRIKSAAGIATLLSEGIGDTIRVSLTEEPEFEIPVAKMIAAQFSRPKTKSIWKNNSAKIPIDPFSFNRKKSIKIGKIGADQPPLIFVSSDDKETVLPVWDESYHPDFIICTDGKSPFEHTGYNPIFINSSILDEKTIKMKIGYAHIPNSLLIIESGLNEPIENVKQLIFRLIEKEVFLPVVLKRKYKNLSNDEFAINATSDYSRLLIDGLLDGLWIESDRQDMEIISRISFGILQATGDRSFKTEYIACPSCGRTLFNIQDTLAKIKKRTSHLKGLKIGVMGCIVNGPGEMADAHFGYVGAGTGKISLYKSNRLVKTNIDEDKAVDELIHLIKENDMWLEPLN